MNVNSSNGCSNCFCAVFCDVVDKENRVKKLTRGEGVGYVSGFAMIAIGIYLLVKDIIPTIGGIALTAGGVAPIAVTTFFKAHKHATLNKVDKAIQLEDARIERCEQVIIDINKTNLAITKNEDERMEDDSERMNNILLSPFDILPNELLQDVLDYLDLKNILTTSLVCRRFNVLCSNNSIWKAFRPKEDVKVEQWTKHRYISYGNTKKIQESKDKLKNLAAEKTRKIELVK